MSPSEQALFRLTGVFSGGFSFDAMESVATEVIGSKDEAITGLAAIVDWGLVRLAGEKPTRFHVLEMIREFAETVLIASGDSQAAGAAHATWCLFCQKSRG